MGRRPEQAEPELIGDTFNCHELLAEVFFCVADRVADARVEFNRALHQFGFIVLPSATAQEHTWSEPVNLSETINNSWFPDLSVDYLGQVHVTWSETTLLIGKQSYTPTQRKYFLEGSWNIQT